MMDPATAVGFAASVAQINAATTQVVGYINDIKDTPKDRTRLAMEAASLIPSLTSLRYKVEESTSTDPWFVGVRSLCVGNGPLDQFKKAMELLAEKLRPQSGLKKLSSKLLWTLDKKEIVDILTRIERMKTLVGLTLQRDNLWVFVHHVS
jgi:hypothetical protein